MGRHISHKVSFRQPVFSLFRIDEADLILRSSASSFRDPHPRMKCNRLIAPRVYFNRRLTATSKSFPPEAFKAAKDTGSMSLTGFRVDYEILASDPMPTMVFSTKPHPRVCLDERM